MNKLNLLIISALICLYPLSASAVLLDNGTTITDSATNYEWAKLDLTVTTSYDQMQSNFADPLNPYFGFQHATRSDLETLFTGAGYAGNFFSAVSDSGARAAIADLFSIFGQTGTDCCPRADGFFDDGDTNPRVGHAYLIPDLSSTLSIARIRNNAYVPTQIDNGLVSPNKIGHWIFKAPTQAIPEAPFFIFGFALAAFVIRLSRR